MFGGKDKSATTASSAPGASGGLNSLVKDTHVEGTIRTASDFRIEGTLVGTLDCQAKLIIGGSGNVDGEVTCKTAMIEGVFEGKLHVNDLLEVRETARVSGEISYGKLKIDAGAQLTGQLSQGKSGGSKVAQVAPAQRNGKARAAVA